MSDWRKLRPLEWNTYVNQEVLVTVHEKQQVRGWVYTVDPVSASLVLVRFNALSQASVTVVMGHAVEQVEILQEADQDTAQRLGSVFHHQATPALSPAQLQVRRDSLRLWLEQNRVPVQEDGKTLRVAGVLTISAPYGAQDCSSPNEIILARVQELLERQARTGGHSQVV
ncbi:gem-associated protein 6 [Aplochiton taeniatus]